MAIKESKALRKVERMRGLPKSRAKRLLWRMHPQRLKEYWLSRDGAIMGLKITGVGILAMFILTLAVFAYFRKDLPNFRDITGSNLGGSISYYDRTGETLLWQDHNSVKRVPVKSENMAQFVKDATVAIEDRDFYKHRGFDLRGIGRAAVTDIMHRGAKQGGSTITQQLVKLTQDFNQNRSIAIKIKELILAVELERTYTKEEILTGYLNAAPYGGVDYGVQAAASDYFHVSAQDLTLAQSAFLAAIPKSPAYYSPYSPEFERDSFIGRKDYVLDIMAQMGKISKAQAEEAKKIDVLAQVQPQSTKYAGIQAPYFVLAAKNELLKKYACSVDTGGCNKVGGWKVITTLNMDLQKKAEQLVAQNMANIRRAGADSSAIVTEDVKTGQVVSLVGGTDFTNPEYGAINYAQWYISPGSSFKPYDYAALIENTTNSGAGSVLYDVQQPLPGYSCTIKGLPPPKGNSNCLQNYDFRYPGPLTLRYALGGSRNIPAVKAMLTVGTDKVIKTANELMAAPGAYKCFNPGVDVNTATSKDESPCYGSAAIGDGAYLRLDQHVNGLASLSRLGIAIPQTYILKIYKDTGSKPSYEWKQPKVGDKDVKQVIRPGAAYIVNNILSDPNASYLPGGFHKWHRYNGWETAIKTGTTNSGFDGLMTSWNTQYAVGSWVGYHTRNRTLAGTMESLTAPLTRGMMTYALDQLKTKPVSWTEPSDVKRAPSFVVRSHVGIGSIEPSPANDLFPAWYQPKGSTNQSQVIDKVSNKLATNCTPALAKNTVGGNAVADAFSSDIFYGSRGPLTGGAQGSNVSGSDDVHSCSDQRPSISVTVTDTATGTLNVCNSSCTVTVAISQGTKPFDDPQYSQFPGTVNFFISGAQVKSIGTASGEPLSYTYTATGSGEIEISAQIIDSVLYDTTAKVTVTATAGSVQGEDNDGE